jgi:ATP-binding cassette subfamily B (MDR/TAP) protein 1
VFKNLLRQEVAWFDTQSVDGLASRVADDTALLNTFCGSPVRMLIMNISSVLVGIVTSFFFMWPFAAVAVFTLPFLAFAARARVKMFLGEDEGTYKQENEKSSGGIVIETLSNIRTVASLGIESVCSKKYLETLQIEEPSSISINMRKASMGLGQLIRVWCIALFFWWGGFILHNQPGRYTLRDFLISMFSLLFSITGMAMSMQGVSDPKVAKEAAKRVFELIERPSAIDPLSTDGRKDL